MKSQNYHQVRRGDLHQEELAILIHFVFQISIRPILHIPQWVSVNIQLIVVVISNLYWVFCSLFMMRVKV